MYDYCMMCSQQKGNCSNCIFEIMPDVTPNCPTCLDTGYVSNYDGGAAIDYLCDCEAGDRQFEVEREYYRELEQDRQFKRLMAEEGDRDYRDAQHAQQCP